MLTQPKIARVLFDESHSEAWTIRPELAAQIQPAHPADSSLAEAAAALASRDFEVAAHAGAPLDPEALAGADVLVIAHPSDPKWEHTLDGGSPRLDRAEIEAIERFVRDGGGLIVLGETEQDKYGNNLNELLGRFGLAVENAHRPGLRAPPRGAGLGDGRPHPRRTAPPPTSWPASARPASTAPGRSRSPTAAG